MRWFTIAGVLIQIGVLVYSVVIENWLMAMMSVYFASCIAYNEWRDHKRRKREDARA